MGELLVYQRVYLFQKLFVESKGICFFFASNDVFFLGEKNTGKPLETLQIKDGDTIDGNQKSGESFPPGMVRSHPS